MRKCVISPIKKKKKDINWDAGKWLGYGHVNGCGCWRGWLILVNEEIKR